MSARAAWSTHVRRTFFDHGDRAGVQGRRLANLFQWVMRVMLGCWLVGCQDARLDDKPDLWSVMTHVCALNIHVNICTDPFPTDVAIFERRARLVRRIAPRAPWRCKENAVLVDVRACYSDSIETLSAN